MRGISSEFEEPLQTYSGICVTPEYNRRVCNWKTDPLLTERQASNSLYTHIQKVHPKNPNTLGYVNLTRVIKRVFGH